MADEEVCNLLSQWGLAEYIPKFQQNMITTLAMAALQSDDIKELFTIIGHRSIFNKNWEDWRRLMHPLTHTTPENEYGADNISISQLSDLFIPDKATSTQSTLLTQDDIQIVEGVQIEITTEKNLQNLLSESNEGKALLHSDKSVPLTNSQRSSLVRIISNNILKQNPDQTVKGTTYAEWTQEIIGLFPREKASVYFLIKYVMSTRGAVNRLGGKLPDQINNLKRKYRNSGIIPKRVRSYSTSSQSSMGSGPASPSASHHFAESTGLEEDDDDEHLKDHITWLKNSSDPWITVEEKWNATRKLRLRRLRQVTIDEYLREFPALQKPTGYKLLEADFNFLYSDKIAWLKDVFPLLKEKLFVASAQSKDKCVRRLLTLRDASEDASNLAALLLIPSLMSVSTIALPKQAQRKSWRPSKEEVREGFVNYVTTDAAFKQVMDARRNKFAEFGLTLQPFVVVVGPSMTDIQSCFVVINNVTYSFPNVLDAVDACFKVIWSLDAQYSSECHSTWLFIQRAVYNLTTPNDRESTSANTLLGDLGL